MRITRHKAFKRALRFYKAAFDYVDPYHVIIDPSFLECCVKGKLRLKDDLSTLLAGRVTPMVTSCVMCHLRRNGRNDPDTLNLGKSCYRLKCNHDEKNPLSSADCMISQLGKDNQRHFMIASHDDAAKARARVIPGTPILSIHGKMCMLESPSDESRQAAQHRELKRRLPKLSEIGSDSDSSDEGDSGPDATDQKKKKKRKQKGANPLSCLPKKIKVPSSPESSEPPKKRVRSKHLPKLNAEPQQAE
jgi:U3 small nucleolar RNA-associated protein 23